MPTMVSLIETSIVFDVIDSADAMTISELSGLPGWKI